MLPTFAKGVECDLRRLASVAPDCRPVINYPPKLAFGAAIYKCVEGVPRPLSVYAALSYTVLHNSQKFVIGHLYTLTGLAREEFGLRLSSIEYRLHCQQCGKKLKSWLKTCLVGCVSRPFHNCPIPGAGGHWLVACRDEPVQLLKPVEDDVDLGAGRFCGLVFLKDHQECFTVC